MRRWTPAFFSKDYGVDRCQPVCARDTSPFAVPVDRCDVELTEMKERREATMTI
jgi:hypothetical protein